MKSINTNPFHTQFITLSNTDERQRLVPVLNTILRLSRSEMEMLNCVAKGQKGKSRYIYNIYV